MFGLVYISTKALLKDEIQKNPEVGKIIARSIDTGEMVNDNIVCPIIERRLKQSDCKVNGWIMEGFPYTKTQVNVLKALKIKPSIVFVMEQSEEESEKRMAQKRIDPLTGILYNMEVNPPADETTTGRLVEMAEDNIDIIKKLIKSWKSQLLVIEDSFR